MTAPERDLDATLNRVFGPCDAPTAALIAASIVVHSVTPPQLDSLSLLIGRDEARVMLAEGNDRTVTIAKLVVYTRLMNALYPSEVERGLAIALVRLVESEQEIARLQGPAGGGAS
jgi:hypothetical protein